MAQSKQKVPDNDIEMDLSSFFEATEKGDIQTAKRGLDAGVDPNAMMVWSVPGVGRTGPVTPLYVAASNGKLKLTEALLEGGADANFADQFKFTSLHTAAGRGYQEICTALIQYGAEVNATNEYEETSLHRAAGGGCTELCGHLVEKGAKVDARNKNMDTPLHNAAGKGHSETCKALVQLHLADVNAEGQSKSTPLQRSVGGGHTETCKILIGLGANINSKDEHGFTPLLLGAKQNHEEICEELIRKGADIHTKDKDDCTPLHHASGKSNKTLCETFINEGADVNARDKNGSTPLHHAAGKGDKDTCEALIKLGADVNAKDKDESTPLHHAARNSCKVTCQILIEYKANVDAKNKTGDTPLHAACRGDIRMSGADVVNLLIRNRADLLICNDRQQRPIDILNVGTRYCPESTKLLLQEETRKQADYGELVGSLGTEEETTVKVFLSGYGQVGKTCLGTALRKTGFKGVIWDCKNFLKSFRRTNTFDPTPGVNVSGIVVAGIGKIGLYDFAGQAEFYVTHAMLLRSTNAIFPLVYNITDDIQTQNSQVHSWLSFIKCSNAEKNNKPRIILIASHADKLETTEAKNQGKRRAEDMVEYQRDLFKDSLVISDEVFLINCHRATSREMRRLRQVLAAVKEEMLRERKPVPKVCAQLTSKLPTWTEKKGNFPVMKWQQYMAAVREDISDSLTERVVHLATSYLHDIGEAIYLRQDADPLVVLDSQWLCTSVFGPLMAPKNFPNVTIRPTDREDLVTLEEITRVFGDVTDIPLLLQLLQDFQLCHPYDEERFIFPTRLENEMPDAEWVETDATETIYFGWQIRCHDKTDEFSCDFFPRVQNILLGKHPGRLLSRPSIWKNSIKCVDDYADALVQYSIDKKMVNIIVRSESGKREHCRPMMEMIKSTVYSTLRETSPGTSFAEEVLSADALKKHRGNYTYSESQVQNAIDRVGVVYHDELKKREHLQNLFIDPPKLKMEGDIWPDVVKTVKTNAGLKWKDLARELGFNEPTIGVIENKDRDARQNCVDMLQEWREEKGNEASLDNLISALRQADLRDIAEELDMAPDIELDSNGGFGDRNTAPPQ